MRTIFHITQASVWDQAKRNGYYEAPSLQTEGFIHLSRPHQLAGVAARHFKGQTDLVLLWVNQEKVTAEIKYEGVGNNKFPHIYGRLNLDAVIGEFDFPHKLPGEFRLVGDVLLRSAVLGDEAEIANIHVAGWQQSYKGIIPDDYLVDMPLRYRQRYLYSFDALRGRNSSKIFVAESVSDGLIGFCAYGNGRDPDYAHWAEIFAIYCLDQYKGKKIGRALFEMVTAKQKIDGFDRLYLWVLRNNPTVQFYKKMGGCQSAREKSIEIGVALKEVAYEWTL